MTVCTCFMVWAGWMKTTEESLAICLSRRNLPPSVMLPSQMRMIRYFDAIMKGTHLGVNGVSATLFRTQFHTGFVQLYKVDFGEDELDASVS